MSGGADNIKKFSLPEGEFLHNMLQEQRAIVNSLSLNEEGVIASGGDNGSLWCALPYSRAACVLAPHLAWMV